MNSVWSGREVFLANGFSMFLAGRDEENTLALQPEPNCYDLMAIVMTSVQPQYLKPMFSVKPLQIMNLPRPNNP